MVVTEEETHGNYCNNHFVPRETARSLGSNFNLQGVSYLKANVSYSYRITEESPVSPTSV